MAQSSFSTQAPHGQRKTFQAGDIKGNQPDRSPYVFLPPPHTDLVCNTPYAMRYGSAAQNQNPFGYIQGSSDKRMEMSKAPLPRESGGSQTRKGYGLHGY